MPTLNWIGKEKIVNHDKDVPFRLLRKNKKYSLGKSENLIVEGDNLEALKALMPFYYGKIKCIYIDPPYNTGNEKWVYNDKVNSPKIKEWLGRIVGPEGEDLTRHDKWLCMMYPRLKLLYDLLADDGVIFVSIDENELTHLIKIMEEIFNSIDVIIWKKSGEGRYGKMKNVTTFRKDHEYIIVGYKSLGTKFNKMWEFPGFVYEYNNPDNDPRGPYKAGSISRREDASDPHHKHYYTVTAPSGRKITRQWDLPVEDFKKLNKEKRLFWGKTGDNVPAIKIFLNEKRFVTPYSVFLTKGNTTDAKEALRRIFNLKEGVADIFPNPKPVELIKTLIQLTTDSNSIVLDSFAGSGTTAHAVLDLNKEDGGNRKFILVEMEKNIAKNITAERVKRVTKGYSYKTGNGKAVKVAGLGGGFEYVELGNLLFDKDGMIDKEVSFNDLASYVYFTETHTNLEKSKIRKNYLGEYNDVHYFLLFDGVPKKNILNRKFLKEIKKKDGKKIVYADKCLIDEDILEKHQIIFKQIPYQVRIY